MQALFNGKSIYGHKVLGAIAPFCIVISVHHHNVDALRELKRKEVVRLIAR